MMRRGRLIDRKEVEIRVRHARTREHKPTPWWMLARKRIGRVQRASARRGTSGISSRSKLYTRRSVVKASYSRNDRAGRWTAHARYLTREGAQHQQTRGIGFDSAAAGLDLVTTVRGWEKSGDELMWRLIVSPEDASRLDLQAHARDLVGSMERDLGTSLEWIGIDHNNTDNPHVHVLIRGRDENGQKLEIAPYYLKSGIRTRSREIVERELGRRPEQEVLTAREKIVDRPRWTELDWSIKQRIGANSSVSYSGDWNALSDRQRQQYGQEVHRLRALERLGIASKRGEMTWELKRDWEHELRRMQRDSDIQKSRGDLRNRGREIERG
jgi:type IV secretory pathway VirD2 relaxase